MQTRAIFWAAVVLFGMCQLSYARIPSGLKWPLPGLPDESWFESDFGEHWQDVTLHTSRFTASVQGTFETSAVGHSTSRRESLMRESKSSLLLSGFWNQRRSFA